MKRKTCGTCDKRKRCEKRTTYTLVPNTYADRCPEYTEKPKPCPFCGKQVEIRGGSVKCTCGLEFNIGFCEYVDFVKTWNKRISSDRY